MSNVETLRKYLTNPPNEFRSVRFWSWNDRLDINELSRQINDFKAHGIGGFFMHGREGLETPFMESEWKACVKASVATARETGTAAWICDDDRVPSGHAAGMVTANGAAHLAAKVVTMEIAESMYGKGDDIVALFRATIDNGRLVTVERISFEMALELSRGESLLIFRVRTSRPSDLYNCNPAADLLDPEAVSRFIEVTHEKYREAVGSEFGVTIPGVFTDEPAIGAEIDGSAPSIPWTRGFADFFSRKCGYDILDLLPYLFYNGSVSLKVRHDFWRTVTIRFSESFSKQIGEWCRKNSLHFTGHFLAENYLPQTVRTSGAVMPNYRFQTIPGIDILGEKTEEWATVRQCSSVANQYSRQRVLAEVFACIGWELTLEGQKRMIDWLLVNGVNLICAHLSHYSIRGCRKRDFPASINYQSPSWKYQQTVEDYAARLCAILSQGKVRRDVLLIHPSSSAWALTGAQDPAGRSPDIARVAELGVDFNTLVRTILGWHYDLDVGDELLLEERGFVETGKIGIKDVRYRVVVVPPLRTLCHATAGLLRKFMQNNGVVIAMTPVPDLIDAEESDDLDSLFGHRNMRIVPDAAGLLRELEKAVPRELSINDRMGRELPDVFCMQRDLEDSVILFVVNTDAQNNADTRIELPALGAVESWDVLNGSRQDVQAVLVDGVIRFDVLLGPSDARLFVLHKERTLLISSRPLPRRRKKGFPVALERSTPFTRKDPNALVLDRCSVRTHAGEWSAEMNVWQSQRLLREQLEMRPIHNWGIKPRWMWVEVPHSRDGIAVEWRFVFDVAEIPKSACSIAVESAELFTFVLNGNPVAASVQGSYLDRAIGTVVLPGVQSGRNELIIGCSYTERFEMEPCFLLGDFAVDSSRRIIAEPTVLSCGDWCIQGYPHFCGSMIYHSVFSFDRSQISHRGERIFLEPGEYSAAVIAVSVNDRFAGRLPWRCANRLDISGLLTDGDNRIDVEVVNTPRNVLGPLHLRGEYDWVDCGMFHREGSDFTPEYRVKPYGLLSPMRIYKE